MESKYGGTGVAIDWSRPYLLVIQHPVTTEYGSGFNQIQHTLKAVHEADMQAIWLWPNVDAGSDDVAKGIRIYREEFKSSLIHFYRNFSPEDYVRVLANSSCIIGNSSSGLREGALLGTPCINIGTRQNRRERGNNVVDANYDSIAIAKAITEQVAHGKYEPDDRFGNGDAGQKMADVLASESLNIDKTLNYILKKDVDGAG